MRFLNIPFPQIQETSKKHPFFVDQREVWKILQKDKPLTENQWHLRNHTSPPGGDCPKQGPWGKRDWDCNRRLAFCQKRLACNNDLTPSSARKGTEEPFQTFAALSIALRGLYSLWLFLTHAIGRKWRSRGQWQPLQEVMRFLWMQKPYILGQQRNLRAAKNRHWCQLRCNRDMRISGIHLMFLISKPKKQFCIGNSTKSVQELQLHTDLKLPLRYAWVEIRSWFGK